MDLSGIDCLVTVSGDGLLWEVVNGLMQRDDWKSAVKVPIAIIPAGTGNALAASLGTFRDPLSAALNVIKGFTHPLDLWKIKQGDKTSWAFLEVAWGILADVDIESEKFRWMGDARYTFGGVTGIMQLRQYKGRLCYLPLESSDDSLKSTVHDSLDNKVVTHTDYSKCPDNWKVIEDEFFVFLAANIPYISTFISCTPSTTIRRTYRHYDV